MGDLKAYQFGDWLIEPGLNQISLISTSTPHDGTKKQLEPLTMNVLAFLLQHSDRVVSSDELLDTFWAQRHGEPGMVARCITQIRSSLGDDARSPHYIQTITKRGYRAIASVVPAELTPSVEEPAGSGLHIGGWAVYPDELIVERSGTRVKLRRKTMDLLLLLSEQPGKVFGKDVILDRVWTNLEVTDNSLQGAISELRKALQDDSKRLIRNVPKSGYMLDAIVRNGRDAPSGASDQSPIAVKSSSIRRQPGAMSGQHERSSGMTAANIIPDATLSQTVIAVLPFINNSSGTDTAYLGDGFATEILNSLVHLRAAPVIARTSSFQCRDLSAVEAGKVLGATHVVEGSVARSGNRLRISAQLIDAGVGTHLWSDSYDGDIKGVFELQDEIASNVAARIGAELSDLERLNRGTTNLEVYELTQRGISLLHTANPFEVRKALPLLERAVALDDGYADGWWLLGLAYRSLAEPPLNLLIPADINDLVIGAFETALTLNPNHSQAMSDLGAVTITQKYQYTKGLDLLARSVESNPNDATAHARYGHWLHLTRAPGSKEHLDQARKLNPLDPAATLMRAIALHGEGQHAESESIIKSVFVRHDKEYASCIWAALFSRDAAKSQQFLKMAGDIVGSDYPTVQLMAGINAARIDNRQMLDEIKKEILKTASIRRYGHLLEFPWNETEVADICHLAIKQRHSEVLVTLLRGKPRKLSDADWQRITKKINYEEAMQHAGSESSLPNG